MQLAYDLKLKVGYYKVNNKQNYVRSVFFNLYDAMMDPKYYYARDPPILKFKMHLYISKFKDPIYTVKKNIL